MQSRRALTPSSLACSLSPDLSAMNANRNDPFRSPVPRVSRISRSTVRSAWRWDGGEHGLVGPLLMGAMVLGMLVVLFRDGSRDIWSMRAYGFLVVGCVLVFMVRLREGLKAQERSVQRVLAGDPCTATIVTAVQLRSYAEPRSENQGIVSVRLELLVHLSDGRDEHASWTGGVDMLTVNKVVEGKLLNVIVDPSDLTNLVIEW